MPCKTCGAATMTISSTEWKDTGPFREMVQCANGHTGKVEGREEDDPSDWQKTGLVFDAS